MTFMTIASILQLIGGFIMSVGYFPQIKTSLKTKSVEDIDASYYPFVFSGLALFEIYAITLVATTGSGIMFLITNSLSVLLAGTMLILSIIFRKNNK
jgi:MtN3 and saliva related transmembrane protein